MADYLGVDWYGWVELSHDLEEFKAITMETSSDLMRGWEDVKDFSLGRMVGYEGPACFRMKPEA